MNQSSDIDYLLETLKHTEVEEVDYYQECALLYHVILPAGTCNFEEQIWLQKHCVDVFGNKGYELSSGTNRKGQESVSFYEGRDALAFTFQFKQVRLVKTLHYCVGEDLSWFNNLEENK